MAVNPDAAFSRGDIMRRMDQLERRVAAQETARRLESASIGTGGLRVKGGSIVILDPSGVETMRLSTEGLTLTGLLSVLGSVAVTDGSLIAQDELGDVFRVDPTVPEIFMRKALISDLVDEVVQELLTSQAGVELAQFVNAQLINTAVDAGQTTTTSTTFGDGSSAGPSVSGVPVTDTGRCLVLWGASIDAGPRTDGGQIGGNMSVAISGATTVAADITRTHQVGQSVTVAGATSWSHRISGRSLTGHLFEGLNAGSHTITGKYATQVSGESVAFANRIIIAIAY
jgi:hypothetical protein